MSKRFDPAYAQICGYIPKDLAKRFKMGCAAREINQSEALEQIITAWLEDSQASTGFSSIAELVHHYWKPLQSTRIPLARLEAIRDGAKPTPVEQVYIGSVCGDVDLVVDLAEKLSTEEPKTIPKANVKNGT